MLEDCICRNPNKSLCNIHYKGRNIDMSLISDMDGCGIVIFELDEAIAVFEINYCPKCGRKLYEE